MSDIIQLLPDSVANQIAAGEVIQRPASVIKELVENSIDAGATTVNVICVDAGRTSIQVIDNGKGMSETDARLSFERHATSKIRQADDLFNLHTMGFRGEALASIAAVAQVELKTRLQGDDVGTHLSISGSRFVSQEPCSCPVGSNFKIENLFFNVPARRKFLKSNATELNNIVAAFERIALVYPEVAFTLFNNENELFSLRGGGLRQRIVDVVGKKINPQLLPVDTDTSMCHITGFVGKPEAARKKGVRQFFFVNGRYMRHPYFHKAVMSAYERLVPEGEQVPYFLYFTVNAEDIDVNIHPTKTEIKFENEQAIWQILAATVKDAVGMFNDITAIEFDTEGQPDIPAASEGIEVHAPHLQYNPSYNPFKESVPHSTTPPAGWEQLFSTAIGSGQTVHSNNDGIIPSRNSSSSALFSSADDIQLSATPSDVSATETDSSLFPSSSIDEIPDTDSPIAEKSPDHYQYKGKYIMTAVKSGLMIIDQHRAHVRILYERYLSQIHERHAYPQKIMFPEALHLTPADANVLVTIMPELQAIGFELTDLGGNSWAINSVPSGLDGLNYLLLLQDIVASARDKSASAVDEINHGLALSLARGAAVVYGEVLSNDEMESIINNLFACTNCNYTPDGKKILAVMRQADIDNLLV